MSNIDTLVDAHLLAEYERLLNETHDDVRRWKREALVLRHINVEALEALRELLADKYLSDPINAPRMAKARAVVAKAAALTPAN